jgi:DNA primase
MIPRDFIHTLLGRVDIVDTIERYVPLKKAGANYMARCPFHNEKSPSFSVNPARQFYHCFGCGVSGTAISFIMEYTGKGFVEAVEDLAEQAGLEVPREAPRNLERQQQQHSLQDLLATAMNFYREQLKKTEVAKEYLKGRGLTGVVAARFGMGYSPDQWNALAQVFPDYQSPLLVEAGLVIQGEEGKRYDRFRGRVMFPILDSRGQVIGFGGRVLGQGEPKYLNSPETPVFQKGQELYGLPQARRAIRQHSQVLVVEGYMDVVALSQAGIEQVVATLGTATSATHVQKLLRMADQVVFAFDGDNAGRKAAQRAMEVALPHLVDGKQIGFLFFPEGEDPDSFVRSQGAEAFLQRLEGAIPLSEFLVESLTRGVNLKEAEGRALLLQRSREALAQIKAPAFSVVLRNRLAALSQVDRADLDRLLGKAPSSEPVRTPIRAATRAAPSSMALRLLACVLLQPDLANRGGQPPESEWANPEERALLAVTDFIRHAEESTSLAMVSEHFRGSEVGEVMEIATRREFPGLESSAGDILAQTYQEGLSRLVAEFQDRELKALLSRSRPPLTESEQARVKWLLASRAGAGTAGQI